MIIEKPFGHDGASARELNAKVLEVFDESQVYRIDHYLGKETVQNLLVFRFGNGIFEPLWNRNYIDHVQITAAESLGVERRAAFYESAGAHAGHDSEPRAAADVAGRHGSARDDLTPRRCATKKSKFCNRSGRLTPRRFGNRWCAANTVPEPWMAKPVPGYRQEPGVKPDSATETFVALKLFVDNWRWSGVPFYLRSGKAAREVDDRNRDSIQARRRTWFFRAKMCEPNSLVLNIQPDEGISLSFGAKSPGSQMHISPVTMDFRYRQAFGGGSREAYATLINDCIRGDATLFDRADSVEAAWALVDPILEAWQNASAPPFPNYRVGKRGAAGGR